MKLYLSSSKMGNEVGKLKKLLSKGNKRTIYIPNALDYSDDLERRNKSEQTDIDQLKEIGLDVELIDLREYFGKSSELESKIKNCGVIWVRGGNVFVLRQAMKLSGFDNILKKLSKRNDLLYGGYSAGICVLSPTLKGINLMDDLKAKPYGSSSKIIWSGLGIIDYSIVPHYKSDHKESAAADKAADYLSSHKIPFKTLRDGEVIIVE